MKLLISIIALVFAVQCVQAASTGTKADSYGVQKQAGSTMVSGSGQGDLTVAFAAQPSIPYPTKMVALAQGGSGAFDGDYADAGVEGVTFAVVSDGDVPSCIRAVLTSGDNIWFKDVTVNAGGRAINNIPLRSSQPWGLSRSTASEWAAALSNVDSIGVQVSQNGRTSQSYTIENFMLVGEGFATTEDRLAEALAYFGVSSFSELSAEQRALDSDGDGMTDLNEILCGTDPNDANSVFAAEVVGNSGAGFTIQWPCSIGATYTVWKSGNLLEGFQPLPAGMHLLASEASAVSQNGKLFMTFTDEEAGSDGAPCFYRIVKE